MQCEQQGLTRGRLDPFQLLWLLSSVQLSWCGPALAHLPMASSSCIPTAAETTVKLPFPTQSSTFTAIKNVALCWF